MDITAIKPLPRKGNQREQRWLATCYLGGGTTFEATLFVENIIAFENQRHPANTWLEATTAVPVEPPIPVTVYRCKIAGKPAWRVDEKSIPPVWEVNPDWTPRSVKVCGDTLQPGDVIERIEGASHTRASSLIYWQHIISCEPPEGMSDSHPWDAVVKKEWPKETGMVDGMERIKILPRSEYTLRSGPRFEALAQQAADDIRRQAAGD